MEKVIFNELKESKETDEDTKKFITENVERIKLMIYHKNYVSNHANFRSFNLVANYQIILT